MIERAAATGQSFDFESDFRTADGRRRRVRSVGEAEFADGKPAALIGVFQDVTDRHAREQALRRDAETDALTGLPNRASFKKRLSEAFTRARNACDLCA